MTSGTFVNPKVGASCDPVVLWYLDTEETAST
jgi:hypothetical protein